MKERRERQHGGEERINVLEGGINKQRSRKDRWTPKAQPCSWSRFTRALRRRNERSSSVAYLRSSSDRHGSKMRNIYFYTKRGVQTSRYEICINKPLSHTHSHTLTLTPPLLPLSPSPPNLSFTRMQAVDTAAIHKTPHSDLRNGPHTCIGLRNDLGARI